MSYAKNIWALLRETCAHWYEDNTFRLGAALSYYTVFSIAPIVLIAIAIASLFFGQDAARERILGEIGSTAGEQVGGAIAQSLKASEDTGTTTLATIVSIVLLIVGATTVFGQLQDALNTIWGVKPKEGRGVWGFVKDRFFSFTIVLAVGFLLLVSLIVSTALAAMSQLFVFGEAQVWVYVGMAINWLLSFAVSTVLFALIYKLLPDVEIAWRDVWVGAAITALLFAVGKYLIGLYLGASSWISAYGAAGSLIVLLLWVYYSSQILLFGAEFTQVYANHYGSRLRPSANAEPVTEEARARQGMARETPQERTGNGAAGDGRQPAEGNGKHEHAEPPGQRR